MEALSKHVFYPLWDIRERADRLAELKRLEKSQYWPPERLRELQINRLQSIVQHAFKSCPFYASLYRDLNLCIEDMADLRRLPLVSKGDVREGLNDFLSKSFVKETIYESRTGGSTGRALTLYFDKRCQEHRNAAAMRSDRWAGRDLGTKTAGIWGNPPRMAGFKDWLRSSFLNRLVYLDTMAINEQSVCNFVSMWKRQRPKVIFGHSHSIYMLARYLENLGVEEIRPVGVISTSMMLLDHERSVIEQVMGCKVSNRYGCEEVGLISAECPERRKMHINSEHVIVELLRRDGQPALPGEEAEVVVTDLINYAMPLIRYRVEDMAVGVEGVCDCGRGLPMIDKIIGRVADFLQKADGTLVAGVSLVERTLTDIKGLDQMQLVQESRDELQVNIVPGRLYTPRSKVLLHDELKKVFGDVMRIQINELNSLPQEKTGKYRFSINKVMQS